MTDLRPGDTTPGMGADQLADLAPAGMPDEQRAAFVASAQDRTVDVDVYYERLCGQLEMRLLAMPDLRFPEADVWWRYRIAKRAARPGVVDDPDRLPQVIAEVKARAEQRRARVAVAAANRDAVRANAEAVAKRARDAGFVPYGVLQDGALIALSPDVLAALLDAAGVPQSDADMGNARTIANT